MGAEAQSDMLIANYRGFRAHEPPHLKHEVSPFSNTVRNVIEQEKTCVFNLPIDLQVK